MQFFVKRSDLSLPKVPILGSSGDFPLLDRNTYGTDVTVLTLPNNAMTYDADTHQYYLASNWRTNAQMICNGEAYRRIIESFTEFMQRNATNDATQSVMLYGADPATWPQDAKDRKAAAETGWDYVTAIRQQSDALANALPVDPTADAQWPTRIPPVYIPGF